MLVTVVQLERGKSIIELLLRYSLLVLLDSFGMS